MSTGRSNARANLKIKVTSVKQLQWIFLHFEIFYRLGRGFDEFPSGHFGTAIPRYANDFVGGWRAPFPVELFSTWGRITQTSFKAGFSSLSTFNLKCVMKELFLKNSFGVLDISNAIIYTVNNKKYVIINTKLSKNLIT